MKDKIKMKKVILHYIGMRIEFEIDDVDYVLKQFRKRNIIEFTQPCGKKVIHRTSDAITIEVI